MAGIIIPEQEMISLGESRIRPRETYTADPRAIQNQYMDRVRNANQLATALSEFSGVVGEIDKKNQQMANQQELAAAQAGKAVADIRGAQQTAGGLGGAWTQFSGGQRSADAATLLQADQIRGQSEFAKYMNAYKPYQDFLTNSYDADPNARTEQYKQIVAAARAEYEKANPNKSFGFFAGWEQAAKDNETTTTTAALKAYVTRTQTLAKENAGRAAVMENVPAQWQNRVYAISQEANINPAKISQFVSIENASWNPDATSSRGVRGLTQTTRERYAEIKNRIAQTNPEIAARMKERDDPESSLIALAFEIPRMESIARNILGREPKTSETYLLWNLGVGGGSDMLKAIAKGEVDKPAYSAASGPGSLSAMQNNKELYEGKTVGQAMEFINRKMKIDSPYHTQSRPVTSMPSGIFFTEQTGIPKEASRWYTWNDFKNSGQMGGVGRVDSRIVAALEQASNFLGRKLDITSAHRNANYNAGVGGANSSRHVHGDALDIKITNPQEQREMIKFFSSLGIQGIGVYKGWMHIDLGEQRAWVGKNQNTPSLSIDEIKALQAEGRGSAQAGGFVPARAYNNSAMTPAQSRIDRIAAQFGLSYADSRQVVFESAKAHALNLTAAGNPGQGAAVISDMITSYGSTLPPTQLNELYDARTKVIQLAQAAATAKQTANKNEAYNWKEQGIRALGDETDPQKRAAILQQYIRSAPKTAEGTTARDELLKVGLNFANIDEKASEARLSDVKQFVNLPDFWKRITGKDEAPQTEIEAVRILEQSPLVTQMTPKHLRDLVSERFAFQKSPFGYDKEGKQPAVENMWKAYGDLAIVPITTALATNDMVKADINNGEAIKRAFAPWEAATKLKYSEILNALAASARQQNPLENLNINELGQKAGELTRQWAQTQVQMLNALVKNDAERQKTDPKTPRTPLAQQALEQASQQIFKPEDVLRQRLFVRDGRQYGAGSGPISFVDRVNDKGVPMTTEELSAFKLPAGSFLRTFNDKTGRAQFSVLINGRYQTVTYQPTKIAVNTGPEDGTPVPAKFDPAKTASTKPQGQAAVTPIPIDKNLSFEENSAAIAAGSAERTPPLELPNLKETLRNIGSAVGQTATTVTQAAQRLKEAASSKTEQERIRLSFETFLMKNAREALYYSRMDEAAKQQYFDLWKKQKYKP